jgi:hypothetical protein
MSNFTSVLKSVGVAACCFAGVALTIPAQAHGCRGGNWYDGYYGDGCYRRSHRHDDRVALRLLVSLYRHSYHHHDPRYYYGPRYYYPASGGYYYDPYYYYYGYAPRYYAYSYPSYYSYYDPYGYYGDPWYYGGGSSFSINYYGGGYRRGWDRDGWRHRGWDRDGWRDRDHDHDSWRERSVWNDRDGWRGHRGSPRR